MGFKVDLKEVTAAFDAYSTAVATGTEQLTAAHTAFTKINASDALAGVTADAIHADISNIHEPALQGLNDAAQELRLVQSAALQNFQSQVKETSGTAVITESTLDTLKTKLTTLNQQKSPIDTAIKTAYTNVEDIISLSMPSHKSYKSNVTDAKQVLTHTKDWVNDFNADQAGSDDRLHEILSQINSALAKANGVAQMMYTDLQLQAVVNNSDFNKQMQDVHADVQSSLGAEKARMQAKSDAMNKQLRTGLVTEQAAWAQAHPNVSGMGSVGTPTVVSTVSGSSFNIEVLEKWSKIIGSTSGFSIKMLKASRISRLSDGSLIISDGSKFARLFTKSNGTISKVVKKGLSTLDIVIGIDHLTRPDKNFTRLSSSGSYRRLKDAPKSTFSSMGLYAPETLMGDGKTLKNIAKATKAGLKSGIKSFGGVGDVLSDFKDAFGAVKKVKGVAKFAKGGAAAIPFLNIATDAIDVGSGVDESLKLAKKDHLKGNEVGASVVGGLGVDAGKVAVVGAVGAAAAATVAATFSAPVLVPVLAFGAASAAAGYLIDKSGVTTDLKRGWNGAVKGVSKGWNGVVKGVSKWFH
ncbi:MAG: LXG domain-containing protein [Lactobacillus sp.]|nr:LXG domain-containing protein [Lactobacillus sp.]MCI2033086.1 LXG domain-containing protein [Lactobacillus sp.]